MKNNSSTLVILVSLALCISGLIVFDLIEPLGRYIIDKDTLTMDYLLGVVWALLLGLSIFAWPVLNSDKKALIIAWIARCFVTLVFMLFYEYYMDSDSFGYYWNANHSGDFVWAGLKLGDGTVNLWKLASLHAEVLPKSFHLMKVTFSMVGFISTYLFYRAAVHLLRREDLRIFFAFSLFPSIIFWSSTLGKDPVVLLGIAIYMYGVAAWYRTNSPRYIIILLAGIWWAMLFRTWLGPILLAPLAAFAMTRLRTAVSKVFFIGIISGAFFLASGRLQDQVNVGSSEELVSTIDRRAHSTGWDGGSGQQSGAHFSNIGQMVGFLPIGIFTALFRPLPGEVSNPFGWLAGFENVGLLWMLLQAFKKTSKSDLKDPRVIWAVALILSWSSLYGFISYQNLGAAVRFRLQILPVLLGTLLYLRRDRRPETRQGEIGAQAAAR